MARPKKNTNPQALADKMRKAVLQAAIEGKLTKQHKDDGNARELLTQIETEKQRMVESGELKRQKSLAPVTEEEKPFDIPDNWEWVRLGELCLKVSSGSTPAGGKAVYKEKGISFIRSQNVHNDGLVLDNVAFIDETTHKKKPNGMIYAKDILLNITGASIGRSCVVPDDFNVGNTNQHVLTLRQFEPDIRYFIHIVLTSPYIFKSIMSVQVGGTKEGLSASKAKDLLIPLPPLTEQKRIVTKLQEVMPQLDELKADEDALHALQTAFPRQMQASLLQAAIEGKLTQQDATIDGNAHDLLADIQNEKQRLIKAGEIKRQKTLPPITEEEKLFDLPDNWEWVRLGDISDYGQGRQTKPENISSKSLIIEMEDIEKETFKLLVKNYDRKPKSSKNYFKSGDVLYGKLRPYLKKIIIADEAGYCSTEIVPFDGFGLIASHYLKLCMSSPSVNNHVNSLTHGMDMPRLGTEKARNLLIPLPPLAEQQRIVDLLEKALPEIQTLKET